MHKRTLTLIVTFAVALPLVASAGRRPNRKYLQFIQQHRRAAPTMLRNLPEGSVVETRTAHVALAPHGARIERRGAVKLEPGEHRIVIPALPHAMDDATLQISGFGDKAVAGTTFLEAGTLVDARPPELVELEKALDALVEQEAALAAEETALAKRSEILMKALTAGAGGGAGSGAAGFDAITRAMDFAQEELLRINAKAATSAAERRKLAPEILSLRTDQQVLLAELQRPVKHVVVEVAVSEATELALVIRYFVAGPHWKARHLARYDSAAGNITLQTYAWIVQETGETWDAVTLEIADAVPSRGLLPPASRGVFVRSAPETDRVAGQAYGLSELAGQTSGVVAGGGRRFSIDGNVTIESGPRGKRVLLESMTVPAVDLRVAVPRQEPGVFLLLTFTNGRITPLLPGEASLFNGADYVGTARLPAVPPGDDVSLPFGRDPLLSVERKLTARSTAEERRSSTTDYRWTYTVRNGRAHPVSVAVRDQLPVSKDRRVKVSLRDAEPAPARGGKSDPPGLLTWRLDVPAGGEESWELGYTVRAPKGRRVIGLDLPPGVAAH